MDDGVDDEEPSSSARRHSGYKLEWLQSISLEGLQCLAKIHDLDPSADVPELIEGLPRDDDYEERATRRKTREQLIFRGRDRRDRRHSRVGGHDKQHDRIGGRAKRCTGG